MNVCFINNIPSPHVIDLFNYINKNSEINVEVIYLSSISENRNCDIANLKHQNIILSDNKIRRSFFIINLNYLKIFKKLNDKNTIYIITGYGNIIFQLIMYYFIITKKKWILWGERPKLKRVLFKKILFYPLKKTKAIIGIGSYAARIYRDIMSKPSYNLPYIIDIERYLKIDRSNRNYNQVRFMYCGSLIHSKGVDLLATAFIKLRERYDYIEMLLIGDGKLKENIKKIIPKPFISSFRFFDFIPYNNLHEYYEMGDVFVFPTRYDGWGVVINEAMASGMPVITTYDCGASFDLILESYNGFLCPTNNLDCLINKMEFFLINRKAINYMGNAARNTAKNLLSLPNALKNFEWIMNEVKGND